LIHLHILNIHWFSPPGRRFLNVYPAIAAVA
jgi:hypothetical protein